MHKEVLADAWRVLVISQAYTLVSLELRPQRTVVDVRGVKIGWP